MINIGDSIRQNYLLLDDEILIECNYEEAKRKSEFVQETLTKSGFIPSIQKSK